MGHLKNHHPVAYGEFDHMRTEEKKAKLSATSSSTVGGRQVTLQQHSQLSQPFTADHPKQRSMTKKIAKMICHDLRPLSIITDEGFRDLKVAEPRYVCPSRKTMTNDIIPKLYEETRTKIRNEISSSQVVSLALTTDGWSSCNNQSYVSFTAHFVNEDLLLKEFCLRVAPFDESHTAINLAQAITNEVRTWTTPDKKIDSSTSDGSQSQAADIPRKIPIYVVTDNAANIASAVRNYTEYMHVPCFAHTIQLCLNDALSKFPQFDPVFEKAKKITNHFRHSRIQTKKLSDMETQFGMQQLKLKQECPTRWNSKFHMIQRLLAVKAPLSAVLINDTKVANLTPAEWKTAENLVAVLAKLENVTALMSGSKYPTVSMVIPTLNELKQSLWRPVVDGAEQCIVELCHALVDSIDHRCPNYERSQLYAPATLLDPHYKDCAFLDSEATALAWDCVVDLAIKFMTNNAPNVNTTSTSNPRQG